jgi:hypothetical protein
MQMIIGLAVGFGIFAVVGLCLCVLMRRVV